VDHDAEAALLGTWPAWEQSLLVPGGPPPAMPGGKRLAPLAGSVFKVLRQTHPDATPKAHAMAAVLELLARVLDKVIAAAAGSAAGGVVTITAAAIKACMPMVVTGELGKHAMKEIIKAVEKFENGNKKAGLVFVPAHVVAMSASVGGLARALDSSRSRRCDGSCCEYLCAEVWELAGTRLKESAPKFVFADDVLTAICNDEELPDCFALTTSDCDDVVFQWYSRDPANDAVDFSWASFTAEEESD